MAGAAGGWPALLPLLLIAYFLVYILVIQPPRLPGMGSYGLHFPHLGGELAVHSGPIAARRRWPTRSICCATSARAIA